MSRCASQYLGPKDTSPLETQASPVALLQVPPAGASGGMRVGLLLPVFALIVSSRVVELPPGGARVPLAVGIAVAVISLAPLGGVGARGERGHDRDRQQAGEENPHGRFQLSVEFYTCVRTAPFNAAHAGRAIEYQDQRRPISRRFVSILP